MWPAEPSLRQRTVLLGMQHGRFGQAGQLAGAEAVLHSPPVRPEHPLVIGRTLMPVSTASSSSSPMCTNCWGRSSAAANPKRSSAVSRVCRRLCIARDRHRSAGTCLLGSGRRAAPALMVTWRSIVHCIACDRQKPKTSNDGCNCGRARSKTSLIAGIPAFQTTRQHQR